MNIGTLLDYTIAALALYFSLLAQPWVVSGILASYT